MEAATLKMKKQVKKGKLKKTMKNVLCSPDTNIWPQISEDEGKSLIELLNTLKVDMADFTKLSWQELSHIPKELRPKPPPIRKVEGLLFGITECKKAIEAENCIGVLIDAAVNPKTIFQPLIEICSDKSISVLCLKDLKSTTKINFGIPTSVLGVKKNILSDLEKKILEIAKYEKRPMKTVESTTLKTEEDMDNQPILIKPYEFGAVLCPYLYRTCKRIRVFQPSLKCYTRKRTLDNDFIKVSNSSQNDPPDNKYMKMVVRKISSNPNRKSNLKD